MAELELKYVDGAGKPVAEGSEDAAYVVNPNDPIAASFIDGLKKKDEGAQTEAQKEKAAAQAVSLKAAQASAPAVTQGTFTAAKVEGDTRTAKK